MELFERLKQKLREEEQKSLGRYDLVATMGFRFALEEISKMEREYYCKSLTEAGY